MRYVYSFLLLSFLHVTNAFSQDQIWHKFMDSITSFSSPHAVDLNSDGILDIVLGGGVDGVPAANGIMAFNGADGSVLWKLATHDEIFISANFQDINNDGTPDVFIGGREAQFYALDGNNGSIIWQFYPHPYPVSPGDSGLWNFYSPQFIPDVNGDGLNDLLLANGGDHSLPLWETNRPPGHLMVLDAATGGILAKAVVPDSAETYCSPLVIDLKNDGQLWVLFGTGGESIGGSFYVVPLSSLLNENIMGAIQLATHPSRGFIAPPSVHKSSLHAGYDIVVQGFGGTIYKFRGDTFDLIWSTTVPGTESSAQPVLGNFTGADFIPDVFAVLFKGNMTSYTHYYQVMLNGLDGSIEFMDSLGMLHFPSGNAVDLNNDGRDEAIASITYHANGYFHHKLLSFDFQNNSIEQIHQNVAGVNLGCTPLITDIDGNGQLDLIYVVRKDSLNPVGVKGINIFRVQLNSSIPNAGVAWGSYLGNEYNGIYTYSAVDCGQGSVVTSMQVSSPTCNGLSDGQIAVNLVNPSFEHTYLWSTQSVSPTLQNVPAGTYEVRVTNNQGCYEDVIVNVNNPYFISYGGIQAPTCPDGSNGIATFSSTGCPCMFNTCVFTWSDGFIGANNNQLTSGEHTITIQHPDGCIVTETITIPEAAPIILESIVNSISCHGLSDASIQLTANPSFAVEFNWSNGNISNQLSDLGPGEYVLTVSDNRPCTQIFTFEIVEPELLSFEISTNHVSCHGEEDGILNIIASGGTPEFTYFFNGTEFNQGYFDGLEAGTYSIGLEDANGCIAPNQNIDIVQPDPFYLNATVVNESSADAADGSITIEVVGGVAPLIILWQPPLVGSGFVVQNVGNGVYSVTITDANGCQASAEVTVQTLSLDSFDDTLNWLVYPNPSSGNLYIDIDGLRSFEMHDLAGKQVMKGSQQMLDLTKLSSGQYILTIQTERAIQQVKVLVSK